MVTFFADVVSQADKIIKKARLTIGRGSICNLENSSRKDGVDFSHLTLYPGLINAHDHLMGTYLPRVGNGPYLNWKGWDEDLKQSPLYEERSKISVEDIYELSFYRQILSGVTTVSDHIPHHLNKDKIGKAPIRIIKDYALAHEVSSYDLNWGEGLEKEIVLAKKKDIPFITHIEEGWDKEAVEGVEILEKKGGLFENTVLIHCIACSRKDIERIARAGSSIVWCPSSNMFMFKKTCDVSGFLKKGANVTLGTDSPMSGAVNLFEEMRYAQKVYKNKYGKPLKPKILFKMVTENPAKAFKLSKHVGKLAVGYDADILALRKTKEKDLYKRLIQAKTRDIEFLMVKGKIVLCKEAYADTFNLNFGDYQEIHLNDKDVRWLIGKPLDLKKRIKQKLGFDKFFEFFPIGI